MFPITVLAIDNCDWGVIKRRMREVQIGGKENL